MTKQALATLLAAAMALAASGPSAAHDRDPETGSKAAERLDRETDRAAARAEERAARFEEERARILEREVREPAKAAEDLAKLDADMAKEELKSAEDIAKAEADYEKESAKEAEDAAEDAAELADDMEAGDREDASNRGSSEQIRDLGESEGADHDADGFPVRRGELVAVDLPAGTVTAAERAGFRVIERRTLDHLGSEMIRFSTPEGMASGDGLKAFRAIDPAATVDFVHYYGLNLTAGGKGRKVKGRAAPAAGSSGLAIGIIDTSIARHEMLGRARIVAWSEGALGTAPTDHGTAVASIVAAGSNPTIYSANIFRGPADKPYTSADVIADALEWMLGQDVQTINMSLAGPRNRVLDRLLHDAIGRGRTVVAAAGNGGPSAPPAYPAAVPGVIAVTAVDSQHRIYRYANRGRYITVAAPGVDVLAARARGGMALFTGTSFAAPHVTTIMARCRSDGASAETCTARLRSAARDLGPAGFDDTFGYGLVD